MNIDYNRSGLDFLVTEAETGLMFADFALTAATGEFDKIRRNTANARLAYDTILRFRDRFKMDSPVGRELGNLVDKLRRNLIRLNEEV